ncbi:MAG TPA: alkanesulfonate monooxygenase [Planctomycetaceae bacterium]|nr:alkanesulfonate monooxygenase [Blastopirellula sp.]HAY79338.1 alkanesulfonate monooxygenase [Planctomycetaceae bacterium]
MQPSIDHLAIRSPNLPGVEVSWFSALCGDDYEWLGVPDGHLRSSWQHCRDIVLAADRLGYNNVLLPSGYVPGQNALTFAGGMAALANQISLLVAIRCGEYHPPMLARAISSLDHMLQGRLTINIISSDMPGTQLESTARYARSREVVQILRQAWTQEEIHFQGDFYDLHLPSHPGQPYQQNGGPLLYFGGISPAARDLCAEHCDVFLMWPETEPRLAETMLDLSQRAAQYGRQIDFGLRIHVIVRETEQAARAAAQRLVSRLDDTQGLKIKQRSQDAQSAGVKRQDALREAADDDGFIEPYIWSGIGRARSGCGSAIVGDPDQVYEKIQRYIRMGMRSFIFSGYPHLEECELFAKYVLPRLDQCVLAREQGRLVADPVTPLTTAIRS